MRPTYAHLSLLIDHATQPDRAPSMPLLGPLTGLSSALVLWTGIGWLFWSLLAA
jgi:hypothetical protein